MDPGRRFPLRRTLAALLLFGSAFGYVEAAVVSYLRDLHEPARQRFYPGRPAGQLFPLVTLEQLRAAGPVQSKTLAIEIVREAATIVMLGAVALAVAGTGGQWVAAFAVAFGIWDIAFYVFLKLLLGWPASVFTWDILFLIPAPWTGPVLAPALVSIAMVGAGIHHLWRDASGARVRIGGVRGLGIASGAALILASFLMEYRRVMAGGMPHPFHWGVFGAGLALGILSYASGGWRVES
jgi:hypothetical protein